MNAAAEDVFLPYVRVLVSWTDIEAAVVAGAIVPSEAHILWSHWAADWQPHAWGRPKHWSAHPCQPAKRRTSPLNPHCNHGQAKGRALV